MITHIWNWIKGWFHKEEIDPHVELYENKQAVKPEHCPTHKRFKKSCKLCQEIIK